jgi:hypothetical protein
MPCLEEEELGVVEEYYENDVPVPVQFVQIVYYR